jgi:hypothetical protein
VEFAEIVHALSGIVVVGFGLFLIGLAALIFIMPSRAEEFLRGFASSAVTHYTEQGLRLVVGAAIVSFAGSMRHPELFNVFGWLIIVSTVGLLLVPWQWHNRFSKLVMPPVFQRMKLFALGACVLGAFILTCAFQDGISSR